MSPHQTVLKSFFRNLGDEFRAGCGGDQQDDRVSRAAHTGPEPRQVPAVRAQHSQQLHHFPGLHIQHVLVRGPRTNKVKIGTLVTLNRLIFCS